MPSIRLAISAATSDYTAAQLNQMRRGSEWDVWYDVSRRWWVFEAYHSALQVASVKLTYEWNYKRVVCDGSGVARLSGA